MPLAVLDGSIRIQLTESADEVVRNRLRVRAVNAAFGSGNFSPAEHVALQPSSAQLARTRPKFDVRLFDRHGHSRWQTRLPFSSMRRPTESRRWSRCGAILEQAPGIGGGDARRLGIDAGNGVYLLQFKAHRKNPHRVQTGRHIVAAVIDRRVTRLCSRGLSHPVYRSECAEASARRCHPAHPDGASADRAHADLRFSRHPPPNASATRRSVPPENGELGSIDTKEGMPGGG